MLKRRAALVFAAMVTITSSPSPGRAATLFGLVDTGGFFVSDDVGETWALRSALPVNDAVGLSAGETSTVLYLAGRSGVVYRSSDAGMAWTAVGAAPASDVVDLVARPDGIVILLTETGTVWQSPDHGQTFSAAAALTGSDFTSLGVDLSERLFALTRTGTVFRSDDWGSTWIVQGAMTFSNAVNVRTLADDLYVVTDTGDVARSADQGATWTVIGTLSQVHTSGFTRDGELLVASTREGEVATSPDGINWTWRGTINQVNVTALANDTPVYTDVGEEPQPFVVLSIGTPRPNPLVRGRGPTTIPFILARGEAVAVETFDAHGRRVMRRSAERISGPGSYAIEWDPDNLPGGVYFVRLKTESGNQAVGKIVVLQ